MGLSLLMSCSSYTRTSYDSTGLSLVHLSEDVQLLGFKLQSEMAFLRTRLTLGDGRNVSSLGPDEVVLSKSQ
jgi:hypothetical protein